MSLNSIIKGVCNTTRANELLVSFQRSGLLVLNYHGVLAEARADRASHVNEEDAASFRAQLRWLKQHFNPTNMAGVARYWQGSWKDRKPPVLVTFDDGYRNNLTVAAPILQDEGVPAIFFLTAGYLGTSRVLWNDEVRARVREWPEAQIRTPEGSDRAVPVEMAARRELANEINRACKRLNSEALSEYLTYLREKTPSADVMDDAEARKFMSWDEARQLADMGFEIGSHTVNHPILSRLTRERVAAELRESKEKIESELHRPCTALAYPNGSASDVNQTVLEEVRNAGYKWAFMTTPTWGKAGGDRYRISRIGCPGHTDLATFKFYASGLHTRVSGAA